MSENEIITFPHTNQDIDTLADFPTEMGFDINFKDGKGILLKKDLTIYGPLQARKVVLELPEVEFPFDVTGGAERFRNTKCLLRLLALHVKAEYISSYIEKRCREIETPLKNIRLRLEHSEICVSGDVAFSGAVAPFSFRLALPPTGPQEIAVLAYDFSLYGLVPLPAPLLAHYFKQLLPPALREGDDLVLWPFSPAALIARKFFPARGWKIPDCRNTFVQDVSVDNGGIAVSFALAAKQSFDPNKRLSESAIQELSASRIVREADRLVVNGELKKALVLYQELEENSGLDQFCKLRRIQIASVLDDYQEDVEELIEELLEQDPNQRQALLARAMVHLRHQEYHYAGDIYERVADIARGKKSRWERLAATLAAARCFKDADPKRSIHFFERAIANEWNLPELQEELFLAKVEVQDWEGAASNAERLLKRWGDEPRFDVIRVKLAHIYLKHKLQPKKAQKHIQFLLARDEDEPDYLELMADLFTLQSKPQRAIAYLTRLAEQALEKRQLDNYGRYGIKIAKLWVEQINDTTQALTWYRQVAEYDHENDQALHEIYKIEKEAHDVERAMMTLQSLIAISERKSSVSDDTLGSYYLDLAELMEASEQAPGELIAIIDRAVELLPDNEEALKRLIAIMREHKQWAPLLRRLQVVDAETLMQFQYRQLCLQAMRELGSTEQELVGNTLDRLLQLFPNDIEVLELRLAQLFQDFDVGNVLSWLEQRAEELEDPVQQAAIFHKAAIFSREYDLDVTTRHHFLHRSLTIKDDYIPALHELFEIAKEHDQLEEQQNILQQIISFSTDQEDKIEGYIKLALLYLEQGEHQKALEVASKLLLFSYIHPATHRIQFLAYQAQGQVPQMADALGAYLKNLEDDERVVEDEAKQITLRVLAQLYIELEATDMAITCLERHLKLHPEDEQARQWLLQQLQVAENYQKIVDLSKDWLAEELYPDPLKLRELAGTVAWKQLHAAQVSVEILWPFVKENSIPSNVTKTLLEVTQQLEDQSQYVQLLSFLLESSSVDIPRVTLLLKLAMYHEQSQHTADALILWQQILEEAPASIHAHIFLMKHALDNERYHEAANHAVELFSSPELLDFSDDAFVDELTIARAVIAELAPERLQDFQQLDEMLMEHPQLPAAQAIQDRLRYGEILRNNKQWDDYISLRKFEYEHAQDSQQIKFGIDLFDIWAGPLDELQQAETIMQDMLAHHADAIELLEKMALFYAKQEAWDQAAEQYHRISQIAESPHGLSYLIDALEIYLHNDIPSEHVEAYFQELLSHTPLDESLRDRFALLCEKFNRPGYLWQLWAIEIHFDDLRERALQSLQTAVKQDAGMQDSYIELLREGLASSPTSDFYFEPLVALLEEQNQWAMLIEVQKQVAGKSEAKKAQQLLQSVAQLYAERLHDEPQAIDALQQALQFGDSIEIRERLHGLLQTQGEWELVAENIQGIIEQYDSAIERDAYSRRLAEIYFDKLEDLPKTITALEQINEPNNDDLYSLSQRYLEYGDKQKYLDVLQEIPVEELSIEERKDAVKIAIDDCKNQAAALYWLESFEVLDEESFRLKLQLISDSGDEQAEFKLLQQYSQEKTLTQDQLKRYVALVMAMLEPDEIYQVFASLKADYPDYSIFLDNQQFEFAIARNDVEYALMYEPKADMNSEEQLVLTRSFVQLFNDNAFDEVLVKRVSELLQNNTKEQNQQFGEIILNKITSFDDHISACVGLLDALFLGQDFIDEKIHAPETILWFGDYYIAESNILAAFPYLQQIIEQHLDKEQQGQEAYLARRLSLAKAYIEKQEPDRAITLLRELTIKPNTPAAEMWELAHTSVGQELELATWWLETAKESEQEVAYNLLRKASDYFIANNREQDSVETFKQLHTLGYDLNEQEQQYVEYMISNSNKIESIDWALDYMQKHSLDSEALAEIQLRFASIYKERLGLVERGTDLMEQAWHQNPTQIEYGWSLIIALEGLGEFQRAHQCYQKLFESMDNEQDKFALLQRKAMFEQEQLKNVNAAYDTRGQIIRLKPGDQKNLSAFQTLAIELDRQVQAAQLLVSLNVLIEDQDDKRKLLVAAYNLLQTDPENIELLLEVAVAIWESEQNDAEGLLRVLRLRSEALALGKSISDQLVSQIDQLVENAFKSLPTISADVIKTLMDYYHHTENKEGLFKIQGVIYEQAKEKGETEEQLTAVRAMIAINPDDDQMFERVDNIYQQYIQHNSTDQAMDVVRLAMNLSGEKDGWFMRGMQILISKQAHTEIQSWYDSYQEFLSKATNAATCKTLAEILDRSPERINYIRKALEYSPEDAHLLDLLEKALASSEHDQEYAQHIFKTITTAKEPERRADYLRKLIPLVGFLTEQEQSSLRTIILEVISFAQGEDFLQLFDFLSQPFIQSEDWEAVINLSVQITDKALDPVSQAFVFYRMGTVWQERLHNADQARECFSAAVRAQANHVQAHQALAELYYHEENWELALNHYRTLIGLGVMADNATIAIRIAELHWKRQDLSSAVTEYMRALSIDGSLLIIYKQLALLKEELGDIGGAQSALQNYIDRLSDDETSAKADAYVLSSKFLEQQQQLPQALEQLEQAIALESNIEVSYRPKLLSLYLACENWEKAIGIYNRMLQVPELSIEQRVEIFSAMAQIQNDKQQQPSEAIPLYEQAFNLAPANPDVLKPLIALYEDLEDKSKFIFALERLFVLEGEENQSGELLAKLGQAYLYTGENSKRAMDLIQMAKEKGSVTEELVYEATKQSGDIDEFIELEEKALADHDLSPEQAVERLESLAQLYLDKKQDVEKAAIALYKAHQLVPQDMNLIRKLAETYTLDQRYYAHAQSLYQSLSQQEPFDVDAQRMLARLFGQTNEMDKAFCHYTKLLTLNPGDEEAISFVEPARKVARPLTVVPLFTASPEQQLGASSELLFFNQWFPTIGNAIGTLIDEYPDQYGIDLLALEPMVPPELQRELVALSEALSMDLPETQLVRDAQFSIRLLLGEKPRLLVGERLLNDFDTIGRNFMLSKVLLAWRQGFHIIVNSNPEELGYLWQALLATSDPTVTALPEAMEWKERIDRLEQPLKEEIEDNRESFQYWSTQLDVLQNGLEELLLKMSLLCGGDISSATRALAKTYNVNIDSQVVHNISNHVSSFKELFVFASSQEYMELRKQLGLAISGEA